MHRTKFDFSKTPLSRFIFVRSHEDVARFGFEAMPITQKKSMKSFVGLNCDVMPNSDAA